MAFRGDLAESPGGKWAGVEGRAQQRLGGRTGVSGHVTGRAGLGAGLGAGQSRQRRSDAHVGSQFALRTDVSRANGGGTQLLPPTPPDSQSMIPSSHSFNPTLSSYASTATAATAADRKITKIALRSL